jgi:hypothetical protein
MPSSCVKYASAAELRILVAAAVPRARIIFHDPHRSDAPIAGAAARASSQARLGSPTAMARSITRLIAGPFALTCCAVVDVAASQARMLLLTDASRSRLTASGAASSAAAR